MSIKSDFAHLRAHEEIWRASRTGLPRSSSWFHGAVTPSDRGTSSHEFGCDHNQRGLWCPSCRSGPGILPMNRRDTQMGLHYLHLSIRHEGHHLQSKSCDQIINWSTLFNHHQLTRIEAVLTAESFDSVVDFWFWALISRCRWILCPKVVASLAKVRWSVDMILFFESMI